MAGKKVVYTSETGQDRGRRVRPPEPAKTAPAPQPFSRKGTGKVVVRLERSGRGGKTVTLVEGLPLSGAALTALARELRAACGTGGTVKGGNVELQGDHRAALVQALAERGYLATRGN